LEFIKICIDSTKSLVYHKHLDLFEFLYVESISLTSIDIKRSKLLGHPL